ncbi:adenyl-nucleotide exchange factor sse1 [Dimargaris cristalligena]|uniref:Putative heat shock protein n=1 Tax=Dimargaris cristalligena TaxID=215637 RepID=A0A4P9ZUA8_9FUNG|nr:adenyl-nucleotide exchange factor sse1 [Dimargaris cristalligena]RKP37117.1 putative heat shock protein [Dimargaris cristalligena]|eukprot:RKP37117.1 putative heat shock protein [Dimargaris cristalligena]
MSVIGIDFGNLQSLIAVARNRGIDIVCNEVSNRTTPSLVSFGTKRRFLGEAAKTQEVSNFRNTVGSLKRLVGRSFADKDIQEVEAQFITAPLCDVDGEVGVRVQYLGSENTFSATQLVAMYLSKLRETASADLKTAVSDVVISVPGWYTDSQRRHILSAAEIAGLNCLRLMSDTAAAALGYGITKTDLPEDTTRHVAFVDMGHSSYSVAIVGFRKGQLTIKSTSFDRHLGGRYFDEALVNHFADHFMETKKIDIRSNKKAILRLRVGCEKLKKVLSANPQAMLNVENIMDDMDVSALMNREEFEALIAPLIDRMINPLEQALALSGLQVQDVDFVEMVGGCTRIPAVKQRISEFFQRELSFTLNQDEAVARGCALQCAMLSPAFKVRDFQVRDTNSYPIKFVWEPIKESPAESELVAFPRNNVVPSTKILTFYRRNPFDVEAYYARPEELPHGIKPWLGRFSIKGVTADPKGELSTIKVKARLNIHGILSVDSAYVVEDVPGEEEEEVDESGESPAVGEEAAPKKTVKKQVRKQDLQVVGVTTNLDVKLVQQLCSTEGEMASSDKLVVDTEHKKNEVEEYVYEMRSKVEGSLRPFLEPSVLSKFLADLNDTEDWLYGDGDDTTKSAYVERLNTLRSVGDGAVERQREAELLPKAETQLRDAIRKFLTSASGKEERFAHIAAEEKKKVVERAQKAQTWLDNAMATQKAQPAYAPLAVFASQINTERTELAHFATPILSKPKPKPATPEPAPAAAAPEVTDTTATPEAAAPPKSTGEMDVD